MFVVAILTTPHSLTSLPYGGSQCYPLVPSYIQVLVQDPVVLEHFYIAKLGIDQGMVLE